MHPLKTITLPQYEASSDFMERFLDAIHIDGQEITRSPKTKGIKLVNEDELDADALKYFIDNKTSLEDEFFSDLSQEIGTSKTEKFCQAIGVNWYDGRAKRNSPEVQALKASVRSYLSLGLPDNDSCSNIVLNHQELDVIPSFSQLEIGKILTVNDRLLYKHIGDWLDTHPDSLRKSRENVFFRRGLSLQNLFETGAHYLEWDFINSYSIAISAPEKFSQMIDGNLPAIVSADCDYFNARVLFFSPFIKGMPPGQLEIGAIPKLRPDLLQYQGQHGGIHEYLVGSYP